MKVLNLYAGIGGNRKLWTDCDVTAVEYDESIATIYQDFYPQDTVIVTDAHQYLLEHYQEYDFIWASPPCPSHSKARRWGVNIGQVDAVYPDMKLYQEIIFLQHYYKGLWAIENVIPYYEPLIKPSVKLSNHLIWCNFFVASKQFDRPIIRGSHYTELAKYIGVDLNAYKLNGRKDQILRNMVDYDLGLHIFNAARYAATKQPAPNQQLTLDFVNAI